MKKESHLITAVSVVGTLAGHGIKWFRVGRYSNPTVSSKEAAFTIKNTDIMDGAEIAQLYVSKRTVMRSARNIVLS